MGARESSSAAAWSGWALAAHLQPGRGLGAGRRAGRGAVV